MKGTEEKRAERERGGRVKGRENIIENKPGELGAGFSESPAFVSTSPQDLFP